LLFPTMTSVDNEFRTELHDPEPDATVFVGGEQNWHHPSSCIGSVSRPRLQALMPPGCPSDTSREAYVGCYFLFTMTWASGRCSRANPAVDLELPRGDVRTYVHTPGPRRRALVSSSLYASSSIAVAAGAARRTTSITFTRGSTSTPQRQRAGDRVSHEARTNRRDRNRQTAISATAPLTGSSLRRARTLEFFLLERSVL